MEDLLYLYAESFNVFEPIVCFDERPLQLLSDLVEPLPGEPGQPPRIDYQYSREGMCNLFVFYALHYGWRHVEVTKSRTKQDFAYSDERFSRCLFPESL
jgi:hypothetical protein